MVRETLWALFPQVREISSFAVMLLVALPDGWPLPRWQLLDEQHGGHNAAASSPARAVTVRADPAPWEGSGLPQSVSLRSRWDLCGL